MEKSIQHQDALAQEDGLASGEKNFPFADLMYKIEKREKNGIYSMH